MREKGHLLVAIVMLVLQRLAIVAGTKKVAKLGQEWQLEEVKAQQMMKVQQVGLVKMTMGAWQQGFSCRAKKIFNYLGEKYAHEKACKRYGFFRPFCCQ
jgi:hypothetical protein